MPIHQRIQHLPSSSPTRCQRGSMPHVFRRTTNIKHLCSQSARKIMHHSFVTWGAMSFIIEKPVNGSLPNT